MAEINVENMEDNAELFMEKMGFAQWNMALVKKRKKKKCTKTKA